MNQIKNKLRIVYANQKMLENLSCIYRLKAWFIVTFAMIMTLSCTPDIENLWDKEEILERIMKLL